MHLGAVGIQIHCIHYNCSVFSALYDMTLKSLKKNGVLLSILWRESLQNDAGQNNRKRSGKNVF